MTGPTAQVHASAVAVGGRGVLITGASGTGKSSLALEMIALGAGLVADDRVDLERRGPEVEMRAPAAIAGLIEARGVGLLRLASAPARLAWVVDLDQAAVGRLPYRATRDLLGGPCPAILGAGQPCLAPVLMALLRGGELVDPD